MTCATTAGRSSTSGPTPPLSAETARADRGQRPAAARTLDPQGLGLRLGREHGARRLPDPPPGRHPALAGRALLLRRRALLYAPDLGRGAWAPGRALAAGH